MRSSRGVSKLERANPAEETSLGCGWLEGGVNVFVPMPTHQLMENEVTETRLFMRSNR